MLRVRGLVLAGLMSVTAMLAVAALGASGASAALPKFKSFGICEKGEAVESVFKYRFTESQCKTLSSPEETGEFGLSPFKSEGGHVELIAGSAKVLCLHVHNEGELTGEQTDLVKIWFLECKDNIGRTCSNGAAGVITLPELESLLGYISLSPLDVGILLHLPGGADLKVEFNCGTEKVLVEGSVIGLISPVNTLTKNYTLTLKCSAGKQAVTKFENERTEHKLFTTSTLIGTKVESCEEVLESVSLTLVLENTLEA